MKKTLIVLLLTITISPCFSQYSIGVKGGLNFKSISDNYGILDIKMRRGWDLGIFANYHLNEKWLLQTEVLYSEQAYSQYTIDKGTYSRLVGNDFVNISLLAGYKLLSNKFGSLKGLAGMEFNFQFPYQGIYDAFTGQPDLVYGSKTLYCVVAGLVLDLAMFTIDLKYNYGSTRKINATSYFWRIDEKNERYREISQHDNLKIYAHYIRTSIGWKIFPQKKLNLKKNIINL